MSRDINVFAYFVHAVAFVLASLRCIRSVCGLYQSRLRKATTQ